MILIEDRLFFKMDISGFPDIVDSHVAFEFEINEAAGNILPTANLKIDLPNPALDLIINEHVEVRIQYGSTQDSAIETSWRIYEFELKGSTLYATLGFNADYYNTTTLRSIEGNSSDIIERVAKENFDKVQIDTLSTADLMQWVNPNNSDKMFIDQLWLHSFREGSLLVPGILADGTFRLKDILDKSDVQTISRSEEESDYQLLVNGSFRCKSAYYNNRVGLVSEQTLNLDDAQYETEQADPDPQYGRYFNRTSFRSARSRTSITSNNVHDNFFKARNLNLTRLSQFSNYSKNISVVDQFGIQLLDLVNASIPLPEQLTTNSEIQSGIYVVSGIGTTITNKDYFRNLILRKDSINMGLGNT